MVSNYIELYGVLSCGSSQFPGVYMNVTKVEAFIREHVPNASWTSEWASTYYDEDPFSVKSSGAVLEPEPVTPSLTPVPSTPVSSSPTPVNVIGTNNTSSTITSLFPSPSTDGDKFNVLADLSSCVKDTLIGFLIGDASQIDSSHIATVLANGKLVFTSTENLDGLKSVIVKFDLKTLHQRQDRFLDETSQSAQC